MLKQKQKNHFDCCLAASASLMDLTIDEAFPPEWQAHIVEKKGTYGTDIDKTFSFLGLVKNVDYKHVINYFGPGNEDWEIALRHGVINGLLWGRRALLQVPSLNEPGKSHLVAWNYDELWDPSTRKTYPNLDDVIPEHIWIISEKGAEFSHED